MIKLDDNILEKVNEDVLGDTILKMTYYEWEKAYETDRTPHSYMVEFKSEKYITIDEYNCGVLFTDNLYEDILKTINKYSDKKVKNSTRYNNIAWFSYE